VSSGSFLWDDDIFFGLSLLILAEDGGQNACGDQVIEDTGRLRRRTSSDVSLQA
jgi:hypothetical protein